MMNKGKTGHVKFESEQNAVDFAKQVSWNHLALFIYCIVL